MASKFLGCASAVLLLTACGENASRRFTQGDYDRIDVTDANSRTALAQISELEGRVEELEEKLGQVQEANTWLINQNAQGAKITADIANQVVENANVANANAVRDMTRRGACGTRWVQDNNPGYGQPVVRSENIPCTEKDLRP